MSSRHRVPGALAVRVAAAVLAGFGFVALAATPAAAHGGEAPDGTDYRIQVTDITPARPGLTVRVVEAGARLELTNRTGLPIEVLGYHGEPYLEIRPDGGYENANSPTTYLNQTLDGGTTPPAGADPARPPAWRQISTEPVVRWHDQRIRWLGRTPPAAVRAQPDREHRIRDWVVPLREGLTTLEVRGALDWVPPPNPLPWWGLSLVAAAGVGALGALPLSARRDRPVPTTPPVPARRGRLVSGALVGILATGGVAAVAVAAARTVDGGAAGFGAVLQGLLTGQVWPVLAGLGALAAGAYALARRPAADFALALAGACLALFGGATNAAVFARSVVPVPWPPTLSRLVVSLVVIAGAGVGLAGVLRLRAAARRVDQLTPPNQLTQDQPPPDQPAPPDRTATAGSNP